MRETSNGVKIKYRSYERETVTTLALLNMPSWIHWGTPTNPPPGYTLEDKLYIQTGTHRLCFSYDDLGVFFKVGNSISIHVAANGEGGGGVYKIVYPDVETADEAFRDISAAVRIWRENVGYFSRGES